MHVIMFWCVCRRKMVKNSNVEPQWISSMNVSVRGQLGILCQVDSPYSGTCPVPRFSSSLTRLPPALMSSMARAWVMSRVLSPLISMIWSPTWRRHTERRGSIYVSLCLSTESWLFFTTRVLLLVSNWGICIIKCLVEVIRESQSSHALRLTCFVPFLTFKLFPTHEEDQTVK